MTTIGVRRQKQAIAALIAQAEALKPGDPLQAHVTHYICIRVSGFIEQAVIEIYSEYARLRGVEFGRFAGRRLERNPNPNAENLCQLAGDFDRQWEEDLRSFLVLAGRRDAINSVVSNRHRIAHGESVSIGLWQMRDWYERVLEYIRFVEKQAGV